MSSAADLARYVPDLVLGRLLTEPRPPSAPFAEAFPAAVLFADVAGFTALTERLSKRGPAGAEQVAALLNGYFGELLDAVVDGGGDVLKLAGDAALAVWRAHEGRTIEAAVAEAVATALRFQALVRDPARLDAQLATRIGVGAGDVTVMHLGGVLDRWELMVSGPAVLQIAVAGLAEPGQVVLSNEAAALLPDRFTTEPLDDAAVRVRPSPAAIDPAIEGRTGPRAEVASSTNAVAALRAYLPGAVRARLDAGQLAWLAELRTVSVLFVKLEAAKLSRADDLGALDAQVRALQAALYRYEGSLNKLSVDEKGVTALAAMGLPPFAHEDDPLRAIRAARRIREDLLALGARCSIGVAHGRVFSGVIGGTRRCEYTVIGDVVNLAARLTQAAAGGILCDEATWASVRHRFELEALPPIAVKGKAAPVAVFAPRGPIVALPVPRPLVGRRTELTHLAEHLRGAGGAVLILEGEAGIGKSRLVAEAIAVSRAAGIRVLEGATDPTEVRAAYVAFRAVFTALIGLEASDVGTAALVKLEASFGAEGRGELWPLLEDVLGIELPDSALTREMRGDVRADNTRRLLVDLLRAALDRGPLALVIEDMHWLDSASTALVLACARELPRLAIVLTSRPLTIESADPEIRRVLTDPATIRMRLGPLEGDDVDAIVRAALSATSLSEAVVELVGTRAQGNAFFCEELAHGLRDAGVLVVQDGEARVADGVDPGARDLPRTIDAVITSRVDRLPPVEQLTLKVASVIGRVFELRVLDELHPTRDGQLDRVIADLEERELIRVESLEPEPTYAFRHALIVDAVYGLMLFAQRRQLHQALAELLVRVAADARAEPPHALLAHHWTRAGDVERARAHLEKAGEHALRAGTYTEAVGFLTDALAGDASASSAIRATTRADAERARQGRLYRQLGEAHAGLGRIRPAVDAFEQALATLDDVAPWSGGVPLRIASAFATQVAHRLTPRRARGDASTGEVARAWNELLLAYIYLGDMGRTLGSTLIAVNRAEEGGASSELASAYAGLGLTAYLVGLERVGDAYFADAEATAEAVGKKMSVGFVRHMRGFAALGRADWITTEQELGATMRLYDQLGDRRHWTEVVCGTSSMMHFRGRFEERLTLGAQVWTRGKDSRDVQSQAWGLLDQAESLIPLGRFPEAIEMLERALGHAHRGIPNVDRLWAHGLLAIACLRQGDPERARREAEEMLRLTRVVPTGTIFYSLEGYAGALETFIALWRANRGGAEEPELRRKTLLLLGHLVRFAVSLPVALPRAYLCAGLVTSLLGGERVARILWRRSAHAARRLGMPYEEARANLELGLHVGDVSAAGQRRAHLALAREGFERAGAAWDLERAGKSQSDDR